MGPIVNPTAKPTTKPAANSIEALLSGVLEVNGDEEMVVELVGVKTGVAAVDDGDTKEMGALAVWLVVELVGHERAWLVVE